MEELLLMSVADDAMLCKRGVIVAVFIIVNVALCRVVVPELGLALLLPRLPPRLPAITAPIIMMAIIVASRRSVRLLKLYGRQRLSLDGFSSSLGRSTRNFPLAVFEMTIWRGGCLLRSSSSFAML